MKKIQSSPVAALPQDIAGEQSSPLISQISARLLRAGRRQEAARLYQQALVSSQPGGRDVGSLHCPIPPPLLQQPAPSPPAKRLHQATAVSTLVPCPTPPRPPYAPGLFIIHGVCLGPGPGQCCVTPRHCQGHRAGPKESSQGSKRHGQPQHHHRGLGTRPSSTDEPTHPHPATELPWPTGEPSYTGKMSPAPGVQPAPGTGQCRCGVGAEAALSWSHLAKNGQSLG